VADALEVWLIGGYGDVGSTTAAHLLALSDANVVLAGRDADAAQRVASTLGVRARGVGLDITEPGATQRLQSASTVISFTEALPAGLACDLVAAGIGFIDSSADQRYTTELRSGLDRLVAPGAGFVIGAGLVPGLSNVLAADVVANAPSTERIDVVVEMGLGHSHGLAATRWTLANLAGSYAAMVDGMSTSVPAGALRRRFRFDGDSQMTPAIGFGFADQMMIAAEHDLATVRTFLTLQPKPVARLLAATAGSSVGRFVADRSDRFARLFSSLPALGSSGTRLAVEGFDSRATQTGRVHMVSGHDQAQLTAVMVATIAAELFASSRRGYIPVHDLVNRARAVAAISKRAPRTLWTV
jgi:hypothetical protein